MKSAHDGIRSEHMSARVAARTYCTILLMIDTQLQRKYKFNTDIYSSVYALRYFIQL